MNKLWRLSYIIALIFVACTQPQYPGIDSPNVIGGSDKDQNIILYINHRLEKEYYWLDEVEEKKSQFNRNAKWENYLDESLSRLSTNTDDGYVNQKGQRVFYSYIKDISAQTRAEVNGFGIGLHYTIATIDPENSYYGFVVEEVYPNSQAEAAGVLRGDVITKIGGVNISASNYYQHFTSIENNSATQLKMSLKRQTNGEVYDVTLNKSAYSKTPVLHHEVIDVEGKRIGYLVYTSFVAEYDQELVAAIEAMKSEGVEEFILDLRCNGGGSMNSAITLCSALVPERYNGAVWCSVERNKRNTQMEQSSEFRLKDAGKMLSLEHLTVICSGYSASASELVIMGLRGLDFPVTLIGSQTEGKNCGMDVTRKNIDGITLEFAPITFLCFDAKGFGGWGEGIKPDVDLTNEGNEMGVSDRNYPLPRADWGDYHYDVALAAAIAKITDKKISQGATRASVSDGDIAPALSIAKPMEGTRIYVSE